MSLATTTSCLQHFGTLSLCSKTTAYKRSEGQASCRMGPNFADRLTEELLKLPESPIGAKVYCLTALFQADSVISDHTLPCKYTVILSCFGSDAVFSFLVGRNCLQVHAFKYVWKTDELSDFALKTIASVPRLWLHSRLQTTWLCRRT